MRVVPSRIHGIIDYPWGVLIAASPWLFGFADGTAAQWMPVLLGAGIVSMNMITDYEPALMRIVPVPLHLGIDAAGGLLLAASPWLFGFADRFYLPHLVLGLAEVVFALMTRTRPDSVPTTA
jgi:hypothetical protein